MTPAPFWIAAVIALTTMSAELAPEELKIRTENTGLVGDIAPDRAQRAGGDRRHLGAVAILVGNLETADDVVVRQYASCQLRRVGIDARVEDAIGFVGPPGSTCMAPVWAGTPTMGSLGLSMQPVGDCCAGRSQNVRSTCAAITPCRRASRAAYARALVPRGVFTRYVGDPSGSVPERTPPAGECASRSTATSTRRPCAAGAAAAITAITRIAPAAGSFDMG